MKIANTLVGLLVGWGSATALAQDNIKTYNLGQWDLQVGTWYNRSEANYTQTGGSFEKLPSGFYYQLIDIPLSSRYVFSNDLAFSVGGNIGYAESKNATTTRSNSVFNELSVGGEYRVLSGSFDLIALASVLFPLEKVSSSQDKVMTSEGVMEGSGTLHLQTEWNSLMPFAYVGYTYRADGRSHLLPWGVGSELSFSSRSKVGAMLFGYQSIVDDKDVNSRTDRAILNNRVNAGSFYFYGVNPSIMDSHFYYQTRLGQAWTLNLGGGISLTGASTASYYHLGGFLRYTWGGSGVQRRRPTPPTTRPNQGSQVYSQDPTISTDQKVDDFKEDINDGVDQNLFKPRPTPAPRRQKTPVRPNDGLQQQMDDVEFNIELKSNKKKRRN